MDMHEIQQAVDMIVEDYGRYGDTTYVKEFLDIMKPVLPALIRGCPDPYMSAVHLVGLASEIIDEAYHDRATVLDFGKYLETVADIDKQYALSGLVTNENARPRSND